MAAEPGSGTDHRAAGPESGTARRTAGPRWRREAGARRTAGWWRRRSLRFRLTAVASAVLAVALAVSAYVMIGVLGRALVATTDESVYQRAREIVSLADAGQLPDELTSPDGVLIQVLDPAGRITHATTGTDRLVPLLDAADRAAALQERRARFLRGAPYGIPHMLRVRVLSADGGRTVIAARPFDEVETSLSTVGKVLFVGTPLLLVLLAGASWVIIGRTLRPIAALRRGAEEITGTARSRRLPVPESRDEVHSLATTLNAMLDRLERADARQRALVSDAAHELRSPLASIRLQLEVALGHPGGQDDWRETAEGVLEDTTRLTRLAEDLLALARLDERGGALARREPVRLDDLVPQTLERYGRAVVFRTGDDPPARSGDRTGGAAGNGTRADPGGPGGAVVVAGDALDLGRVLVNLVDNALRHTVSPVAVELRAQGADAVLTVTDDGPGIPEADRERVFDRFTRLDSARSRDEGGAGLGLAIVRETVHAHGGAVHLEDASPGLRAVVRLPLS
ncbi:sensor histidine kinase [Planomonospora venezuelensis]|uniref:histidine kinase n=1 Tax=Planomonospora venezuelensis TaxID=1999 RepID=A0A841D6Z8_PLAVE|nr:ATP-binding protein [Planomonospora venezuelensis]MBB5966402.1 signal transduction histidine kinase [Planomonospora venezuelensis]GIN02773.1 two-component sensor histidine kinase [Planomonospora venezuelensis]